MSQASPAPAPRSLDPAEFEALAAIETSYEAKRALKRIAAQAGFAGFALCRLAGEPGELGFAMMLSNLGADPAAALGALAARDPALRARLAEGTQPFAFEDPAMLPGHAGLALPLFCERARGVLLFAVDGLPAPERFGDLHLYALYLFARLTDLLRPRARASLLAPREIECLRWSAAGKTSAEIGGIIGISENTVNSYLSAAAQKMNAVNRVQTVAQAMRLGLLG